LQSVKHVPCPHCRRLTPFTPTNKWRPFCTERCKMIDLGLWGSDAYRLPDSSSPVEDEDNDKG
jgi:endogenous inhibitor of DNA gyrase (YacG/DUF329 family)